MMDRGAAAASGVNIWCPTGAACFGARISYFGDQTLFVLGRPVECSLCAVDHRMTRAGRRRPTAGLQTGALLR